jgi:tungstate transport system permease protein
MGSVDFLIQGIIKAFELIFSLNPYILSITGVSIRVSGTATFLATMTAIPMAFAISFMQFRGKQALITFINTGMGRGLAEVGAILIVGGNIAHTGSVGGIGEGLSETRTLTTAITSETSKGHLSTSIALGIILISLVLSVNILANYLQRRG